MTATVTISPTITPDILIEVRCGCGAALAAEWYQPYRADREPFLQVEPCKDCKTARYDEGHEAGVNEGNQP